MIDALPFELRRYWGDPSVTDVLVNNETEVWIERCGQLERCPDLRAGDIGIALQRVLAPLGRRLDRLSPMVDARLADGTRVCAVIEPVAVAGTCAAFRISRPTIFALEDFEPSRDHSDWSELVALLVSSEENILITGATGSGKSALLGTLASTSNRSDRVIVIEDTYELVIDHPHTLRLESRTATQEGRGSVELDDLLRTALRLRPDRLIVGEVRGTEALTLVQAMSTGHRRCLATIHANSALDGLGRLDVLTMSAAGGWSITDSRGFVNAAIGLVVHTRRALDGRRSIDHVAAVDSSDGTRRIIHQFG